MSLENIVYVSTAVRRPAERDLLGILDAAWRNNRRDAITGLLLHYDGSFMQALEGPGERLDALLARLHRDPRHTGLTVITRRPIVERQFPGWEMACEDVDRLCAAEQRPLSRFLEEARLAAPPPTLPGLAWKLLDGFRRSLIGRAG